MRRSSGNGSYRQSVNTHRVTVPNGCSRIQAPCPRDELHCQKRSALPIVAKGAIIHCASPSPVCNETVRNKALWKGLM